MTGLSLNNFVIYSRIDQAKTLLTTTDLSVAEISAQVGSKQQQPHHPVHPARRLFALAVPQGKPSEPQIK